MLDRLRSAVFQRHVLDAEIHALEWCRSTGAPWHTAQEHVGGHAGSSSPVERAAEDGAALDALIDSDRAKLSELDETIGRGLHVLEVLRDELGGGYADTCEAYYVDGPEREWMGAGRVTWAEVAERLGISERLAYLRRDVAIDWIDWRFSKT
ncbi:MAG: hypothetical protein SOV20_08745 [Coriobacteriales bacterium]|nr:hypothetical protein [Coriobacteriales bacterium]